MEKSPIFLPTSTRQAVDATQQEEMRQETCFEIRLVLSS